MWTRCEAKKITDQRGHVNSGLVISDEERLKLQLQECWATPSSNSEDETKYIFIENSCGIDEEINVYESLNIGIVRYLDSRRVI